MKEMICFKSRMAPYFRRKSISRIAMSDRFVTISIVHEHFFPSMRKRIRNSSSPWLSRVSPDGLLIFLLILIQGGRRSERNNELLV